jgi:transcriptional regulator with GAF, ATPase, and Fis domain
LLNADLIVLDVNLLTKKETTVDEAKFFREATLRIYSSLNIDMALQRCRDYLNEFMPISGLVLGVYYPESNTATVLASIVPHHLKKLPKTIVAPNEWKGRFTETWERERKTSVINDCEHAESPYPEVIRLVWPEWPVSYIHMDLTVGTERIGNLFLFAEGKNRYTEFQGHLISLLNEPFAEAIAKMLQHQEILDLRDKLVEENRFLHSELREISGDIIIGKDGGLKTVMETIRQIAPLNSPILLMGETGVGKEIIANAIHYGSKRSKGPFIKVNCGAIPETLIDSELFGHEKGAFTGALTKKLGRFERAHTGTIFLDEIGELPPAVQVRLLRVLQHHEIERVGGTETISVDVRIISATHRNMEELTKSGKIREDLWFRLNVFPIIIPPLRLRTQDIPALVDYFIERKSRELNIRQRPSLAPGAMERLQAYQWPGNIRELENLLERSLIQSQLQGGGQSLRFDHMAIDTSVGEEKNLDRGAKREEVFLPLDRTIEQYIRQVLAHTNGRVKGKNGAAAILEVHPSTLRSKMKKLGIPVERNAQKH